MSGDHNMYAGGPAFPRVVEQPNGYMKAVEGMTLRDYFAAKALQAILRGYDVVTSFEDEEVSEPEGMPNLIAKDAYIMADAMLKARES